MDKQVKFFNKIVENRRAQLFLPIVFYDFRWLMGKILYDLHIWLYIEGISIYGDFTTNQIPDYDR